MSSSTYDLVVLGGGPAGYAAALYGARASLRTVVVEQGMPGGQIATSDMVDNYPGIPEVSGAELGMKMQRHAEAAGALSAYGIVERVEREDDGSFLITTDQETLRAPAVICALGAAPRQGGFTGEDTYRGRGVSYCATCDGMFYRGKKVFIIGGGNSACTEALYLSRIASEVTMVLRRDAFRAPRGMVQRVLEQENVSVRYLTSIEALEGETMPTSITFRNNATGERTKETFEPGSFGIFVATGHVPNVEAIRDLVELAPDGGVLTDEAMATKTPGLFCAGDMRSKGLRQVVTAAADGAIAANEAYKYLEAGNLL